MDRKPKVVTIGTFDYRIMQMLEADELRPIPDDSAPGEGVYFTCFGVPAEKVPDYARDPRMCEIRDAETGEFVDPETMEYTTLEELMVKI